MFRKTFKTTSAFGAGYRHLDESESFNNSDYETDSEFKSNFRDLPEPVLLNILCYLEARDIVSAGSTCQRWNRITKDDWLWRRLFQRDFNLPTNVKIGLRPGAESWYEEYVRLSQKVPMVLTDVLTVHSHQVLHVSFSHNGKMFCTCSKDGFVIVWNSTYPSTKKYQYDMKTLCWKYTQYSQFNSSDTLLLVSGVHFGVHSSTSGEIAVFGLESELKLRCRIVNRPYDIFGTWFTDRYLLSGDLNWLQHLISSSVIWLNKASQEITSEHVPIMNKMFKFYNRNASSVRSLMVANCPWLAENPNIPEDEQSEAASSSSSLQGSRLVDTGFNTEEYCAGNPISQAVFDQAGPSREYYEPYGAEQYWEDQPYASTFQYSDEFRKKFVGDFGNNQSDDDEDNDDDDDNEEDYSTEEEVNTELEEEMTKLDLPKRNEAIKKRQVDEVDETEDDDLETAPPKYLIFSTGSKAYVPHQIAFKRVDKVVFPKQLDPGPSLKERIALQRMRRESESLYEEPDWSNYNAVSDRFDKIDKIIDLHGQIIGMALSPDHRFLYVNCRVWPQNYVIRNPLEPPPIAQEIDIHVIDLMTFKKVGKMLRAHRAYTPNTDCFFIFLDVCDKFVASGAEDMHAYIWDRYYGMCLAKYEHSDVVNSVAFNPQDNEMLVTTSDDYEIKVWRSRAKVKELEARELGRAIPFKSKYR